MKRKLEYGPRNYDNEAPAKLLECDANPVAEDEKLPRMFTVKTALANYFQGTIGETKLREAIRKGEVPHIRIGAKIILREDALNAWMEEQEKQSTQRRDFPYVVLKGSGKRR